MANDLSIEKEMSKIDFITLIIGVVLGHILSAVWFMVCVVKNVDGLIEDMHELYELWGSVFGRSNDE